MYISINMYTYIPLYMHMHTYISIHIYIYYIYICICVYIYMYIYYVHINMNIHIYIREQDKPAHHESAMVLDSRFAFLKKKIFLLRIWYCRREFARCVVLQSVAVCCSVLPYAKSLLQAVFFFCKHMLSKLARPSCKCVCRSVLQCVAVCCSVLQCVAVPCSALQVVFYVASSKKK